MALTTIKTGGLADNSVTDAKVADAITVTGAQTGITQVGTLTAGVWNSSTKIASAYLDADTAHLSTAQTFSGAKTFSANAVFNGEVLVNNTSSGNAKLYIKGGGTSTANSLYITDSAGADILYVKDNKSAKFYGTLETVGNATFGGDVTISSGKGLIVSWAEGTNSGSYISQFSNLDSTNNQSNGVLIQAGAGASDKALAVRNYAGTDMFIVKGDSSATFSGDVTLLGASSYARDLTFAHGASNYYWRMGYTDTSNGNTLAFINRDGGSEQEVMRMDWNKNTTFAGVVTVQGAGIDIANGGYISSQDSGSGSIKLFGGGTNKGGYINLTGGGNGGDIKMYTGTSGDGALRLTIDSSGFTTLAGDLKISDDLYFNSTSAWLIASGSGGTLRIQTFSYFRVDGVIRGYNDVIAYYSSDPTLKDNAKLIENPLDKLSKINGYTFDWNEKAQKIGKHLTGHDYGVMANEIQDVMPELVETRENGIRAVKYEKIIPLLIECIKKQQTQINELKGIA